MKIIDENATLANAYEYTNTQTPTVSSVSLSSLLVTGDELLKIVGSLLLSSSGEPASVKIGEKKCAVVNGTNTEIFCKTPPNPTGKHRFAVIVSDKGKAESVFKHLEYVLVVDSIVPNRGSVLGGTRVTVKGSGFAANKTKIDVKVGRMPCDVVSSSYHEI